MVITAAKTKTPFFDDGGQHLINAYGFYETVLDGITRFRDEIVAESDPAKQQVMIDAMDARMAAESAAYDAAIAAYPWPTIPAALGTPPSGGTQNGLSYPITSYPLTVYRPYAIN